MVFTRAPRSAQRNSFGLHPQRVRPLGELIREQGVGDLVGLDHREPEQLVGRCGGERGVLLGCERREAVARLGGDDHTGAAGGDNGAEPFEDECGAVEIDGEDRGGRCLARRHAGGVDDRGDVAQPCREVGERLD
jgi:hypothetical protein